MGSAPQNILSCKQSRFKISRERGRRLSFSIRATVQAGYSDISSHAENVTFSSRLKAET